MAHTRITRDYFSVLKTSLRTIWSNIGSSHADEALAAYCGHRTYASLRAAMAASGVIEVETDGQMLLDRLGQFGHRVKSADLDRMLRLAHSEMVARTWQNIQSIKDKTANDNDAR